MLGAVKTTRADYTVMLAGVQVILRRCVGNTLFGLNVGKVVHVYVFWLLESRRISRFAGGGNRTAEQEKAP